MPRIPDAQLSLRSVKRPICCAETRIVSDSLASCHRTTISQCELTFDITGTSVDFFVQTIESRAKTFKLLRDQYGRETLYVCSRKNSWQIRIYDKAPGVVRLEFIFRRGFLRKLGINEPHELLLLQKLDLRRLIRLRELDRGKVAAIEKRPGCYPTRGLCVLAAHSNRRQFAKLLREFGRTSPNIFVPSATEGKLQLMLHRLIW